MLTPNSRCSSLMFVIVPKGQAERPERHELDAQPRLEHGHGSVRRIYTYLMIDSKVGTFSSTQPHSRSINLVVN